MPAPEVHYTKISLIAALIVTILIVILLCISPIGLKNRTVLEQYIFVIVCSVFTFSPLAYFFSWVIQPRQSKKDATKNKDEKDA
jgi:Kef-type K+ transport system membrane component KefB